MINKSAYKKRYRASRQGKGASDKLLKKGYWVLLACLLLYITIGPFGMWRLHKISEHEKQLEAEVMAASEKNTKLRQQLVAIKTDRKFQEQLVRSRLGWVKKNEILYKFLQSRD